jgi:hypothetical protein
MWFGLYDETAAVNVFFAAILVMLGMIYNHIKYLTVLVIKQTRRVEAEKEGQNS